MASGLMQKEWTAEVGASALKQRPNSAGVGCPTCAKTSWSGRDWGVRCADETAYKSCQGSCIILQTGLQPWDGVRQVCAAGSPDATHAVDITDTLPRGIAALEAHRAYLDGLGYTVDPEEFLEGMAREAGTRFGTRFATTFEVFVFRPDPDPV